MTILYKNLGISGFLDLLFGQTGSLTKTYTLPATGASFVVETNLVSDVSAHGTVLRDCVAEGLRFIFTPDGVEDDEETRDNEGPCRAGCEGHPARDAQIAFF